MPGPDPGLRPGRRFNPQRRPGWLAALWPALAALLLCGNATAHVRSESFSRWQYEAGRLELQFTVSTREAGRIAVSGQPLPLASKELLDYLSPRLNLAGSTPDCHLREPLRLLPAQPGYVRATAVWECERLPAGVRVDAFFDLAAEHTHFASLHSHERREQQLLTADHREWRWPAGTGGSGQPDDTASGSRFLDYVKLGSEHIFGGLDHLMFLLAIMLVCRRFFDLAWAISGFTLGHSLTLSLAVLELVEPRLVAVEAVIGLSIALPALERGILGLDRGTARMAILAALALVLLPFAIRASGQLGWSLLGGIGLFSACYLLAANTLHGHGLYRIAITTLFGLVHGFGFAGAFTASQSGVEIRPWMLAGFNIGVELGQLLVVAALWLLARSFRWNALARRMPAGRLADALAASVFGMGLYWFFIRGL